jgi:hypothetical protein
MIGSWFTLRRRGPRAAARVLAWALLPIALYLVGILQVLWRFGVAIGDFFSGLAFSPKVYAGLIIAGISVLLFFVTGGLRRRSMKKPEGEKKKQDTDAGPGQLMPTSTATTARTQPVPAPAKRKKSAAPDEDFDEVADILKRHGIS